MGNVYGSSRSETAVKPTKPACYADPDHFNEYGSDCSVCPARVSCENQIVNLHSTPTQNVPHMPKRLEYKKEGKKMSTTWRSSYRSSSSTATSRTAVKPASQMLRPVTFNTNKPLVKQYVTYVAFDTAEAATTRATELIQQLRDAYEQENSGE